MTGITLREYAEREGIGYFAAWRRLKRGHLRARKRVDGTFLIVSENEVRRGQPPKWTEEKVVREVYRLCRGRYVKASGFPPYLYKLCRKFCGSVRAAKWEAKIVHGRHWTYEKFVKCVSQFCRGRYREDRDWPANLRALAKRFCGSVRAAKWEAGVIRCRRRQLRRRYHRLEGLWTREKFLRWVRTFCADGYKKQQAWPGYMRQLARRYCGSVRAAKVRAGVIRKPRRRSRAPSLT